MPCEEDTSDFILQENEEESEEPGGIDAVDRRWGETLLVMTSSSRCIIKVDLRKAYDSIWWPFLQSILLDLGFPELCGHGLWLSYSILINGKPCEPIQAKKGLRQGDHIYPSFSLLGLNICQDVLLL